MIFGIFAALGKETDKEKPSSAKASADKSAGLGKWDILLIIGLSILGFIILFYKTQDMGQAGLIISAISALLILVMSYLLFMPEVENHNKCPKLKTQKPACRQAWPKINILNKLYNRLKNYGHLRIAIPVLLLFIFSSIYYIYQAVKLTANGNLPPQKQTLIKPSPAPEFDITQNLDEEELLEFESAWNTPVILVNAGVSDTEIQDISKLLSSNHLKVTEIRNEQNSNHVNTTILFKPDDFYKANYIMYLLKLKNLKVELAPLAADKTTIEIIVGKK